MSEEDLADIEARLKAATHWHSDGPEGCSADIAALLAEVRRLQVVCQEWAKWDAARVLPAAGRLPVKP